ncbi:MAG TPA: hypothetical protein VF281_01415 [Candidatus Saccharimonadales bacterium]
MPEQEITPQEQILYVGVVGPSPCGNCDYVIAELKKKGLKGTKEELNRANPSPLHQMLHDTAVKMGETQAPMLYTIQGDGEPKFIGAGRTMYNILKIAAREKGLQEKAQQEAMANA